MWPLLGTPYAAPPGSNGCLNFDSVPWHQESLEVQMHGHLVQIWI